jgi:hypothetical protein
MEVEQVIECILAETKVSQKEIMAMKGAKIKADMKTKMAKMKAEIKTKNVWCWLRKYAS